MHCVWCMESRLGLAEWGMESRSACASGLASALGTQLGKVVECLRLCLEWECHRRVGDA